MRELVTDDVVSIHPDIHYQPLVARVAVVNSNRVEIMLSVQSLHYNVMGTHY